MTRKGRTLSSVKLGIMSNGKMEAQTVPGETWGQESPLHGRSTHVVLLLSPKRW